MVEPSGAGGAGLEARQLALGLLQGLLGQRRLGDALAVAGDLVGLAVLAELLADGIELAPQHELALALLHAVGDVVADAPLQLDLAEHVARPGGRLLQALADVERLEQLELLAEGQVGREAGRVGQRARLLDGAQERDHAAAVAGLEDRLDDGAVGAHLLADGLGDLGRVGSFDDVDAQCSARGVGTAELGAVQHPQRHSAMPARQHDRLALDDRDHADACEAAVDLRDEHDLAVGACLVDRHVGVGGDELVDEGHAGEDDGVLEGDQRKRSGIRHESAFL